MHVHFGRILACLTSILVVLLLLPSPRHADAVDAPGTFTPLKPVKPQIAAATVAYPGGRYEAVNMIDGDHRTEYSSASKGVETTIDFDFGRSVHLAAMRHVDRADPATVARSKLILSDTPTFQSAIVVLDVTHANTRSGVTTETFPAVNARYARWQITKLGPKGHATVGGAEIQFFEAEAPETKPSRMTFQARSASALLRTDRGEKQPIEIEIEFPYAEPCDATIRIGESAPLPIHLEMGTGNYNLPPISAVKQASEIDLAVTVGEHSVRQTITVPPVRPWELWFLPHSHNDIGYTHVQTEVERKQWQYLQDGIALARETKDYPEEARFRWNTEVLWAVESYLKQASEQQRDALFDAVRRGWVGLDALYGNELTALCSPEELFRLTDFARRITTQYGLPIDSAMISDVPGYSWGLVPVFAHSNIKYFSIGPNHIHRIGFTLEAWGDKPFYWKSPSGKHRVLCWMAGHAYSWFHPGLLGSIKNVKADSLLAYLDSLQEEGYPYDMVQLRYSIGGDNGPPDPDLPEYVKDWNARYVWPKLRIATNSQMMREFERRYRDRIPEVRGDFTPYWEDGAASSARETALARNASERLVQAESLGAMLRPANPDPTGFDDAWRNVLLYNEHTWGAHCSISQPDSEFTQSQWAIKQTFALEAERQSVALLEQSTETVRAPAAAPVDTIDVYNTCSWTRSDLVTVGRTRTLAGDRVTASDGTVVPSQRLSDGALAFWAANIPPMGGSRFHISAGSAIAQGGASAHGNRLATPELELEVDEKTGNIRRLIWKKTGVDLAGGDATLNSYHYVAGRSPKNVQTVQISKTHVIESGPLVASLAVESTAPGCRKLVRQIRVVDGTGRIDLINQVDKEQVRRPESVHFGFQPHVPSGTLRMEIPWAVIQPDRDQLPGACKNYFTIGRWVDVSNERYGLTWSSIDAPLLEVGGIHVDVPAPLRSDGWIRQLGPSQDFYSYVMNNYWETNYKASQEGVTCFRYSLSPHGSYHSETATRFGMEQSYPLVCVPAKADQPVHESLFRVRPDAVVVTSLKRSRDGKALMLRLFNASDDRVQIHLDWSGLQPERVTRSCPFESAGEELKPDHELAGKEILTLRAE